MTSTDFQRRFGGIARLYGRAALDRFSRSHVCIIGTGGVGSWAGEALVRSGIGNITLIDMDHVAESNINRQLQATTDNIGKSKILALQERFARINPECHVTLIDDFITRDNLPEHLGTHFDFVIDCIDDFRTKAALISYCKKQAIALLTTGGAGGKRDPSKIRTGDLSRSEQDPLLAKTRSLLRQQYGFARNPRKRFGIYCVWSEEQLLYPLENGELSYAKPAKHLAGSLSCGGLGSSMPLTSSFGQFAVATVLQKLSEPTE